MLLFATAFGSFRELTSFTNFIIANGVVHSTFQKAHQELELFENENYWNTSLKEAALYQSASKLRGLFVVIIEFCHLTNLLEL